MPLGTVKQNSKTRLSLSPLHLSCEPIICMPLAACPSRSKHSKWHLGSGQWLRILYHLILELGVEMLYFFPPNLKYLPWSFFQVKVAISKQKETHYPISTDRDEPLSSRVFTRTTKWMRRKYSMSCFSLCAWFELWELCICLFISEPDSSAEFCEGSNKQSLINTTSSTS